MSERSSLLVRLAPLGLLLGLALVVAWDADSGTRLATPDASVVGEVDAALDAVPQGRVVLVGFDPDLGTWAEIRPTVRTLLADLLDRGARLAFVSFSTEGRALASVELARLTRAGADAGDILDLGFVPGAEAALVALARTVDDATADPMVDLGGAGPAPPVMTLVVGGNDIGPRSWVEQVRPRLADVPIMAVTPSVLLPELTPYLDSGQLVAVIGTPRDGAAYRDAFRATHPAAATTSAGDEPSSLAVLAGLLVAVVVLAAGLAGQVATWRPVERT